MKRRFSKILGVGLTLALITSLLLTAAPVSADVSKPTVDVENDEISVKGTYTISFRINTELLQATPATITVRFPEDTDVGDVVFGDVTVEYTSGIGYGAGEATFTADDVVPSTDDLTVEITLDDLTTGGYDGGIGAMAYVQVVIKDSSTGVSGVTNPTDLGTYTLEVQTSEEDTYVESESYDIGTPTLPGGIYVYNPSGILVDFETDLELAVEAVTAADFTIKVGAGTYEIDGTLLLDFDGLTLESSAGAEDTIIDTGTANIIAISITADDVTVDGFTIESETNIKVISIYGIDGAVVQNNVITVTGTEAVGIAAEAGATDATISGNILDNAVIYLAPSSGNTVSGNTSSTIVIEKTSSGNEITGNTLSDIDSRGIVFVGAGAGTHEDNLIEDNILSGNIRYGIHVESGAEVNDLVIIFNTILDNEEVGIFIEGTWGTGNVIKFNTITGNEDYGIETAAVVDATFNWWGTTVADDIGDMVSADVTYEPFLSDTAELAIFGGKAVANASSLDAKDEAGVKVSGVDDGTDGVVAEVISAVKYTANPEEAIDDAIAFYDVYVVLEDTFDTADVTAKLKFYDSAINTGSVANFWTGDFWAECSDQEARDGIIYVTISDDTLPALDELEETIFGVVAGEAVEAFGAPVIAAPENGADDVSLTPTFSWSAVAGADGYYFEFADNANFVTPLVKLDGDLGRLIVTAYAYVTELPYSTAYYWRVKAVSGTIEAGDLEQSGWVSGVFITKAEPEEPTPPVVIEPYEPPIITIEQPDIIVPLPEVTEITPSWIYVIIGVGAVLVIGLIVLIVRTRRVA